MRPSYAEYIKHATRFYLMTKTKGLPPTMTEADEANYGAVKRTMGSFIQQDRKLIEWLYGSGIMSMPDAVNRLSAITGTPKNRLWDLVSDYEKRCATERGLI